MGRDYYEILGVKQNATEDEIRRAYRKLAKQHHPDRNPDDPAAETKFKEVQQAYATLSDARKRAEYDRFGAAGVGQWSTDPRGQRVYQWGGGSAVRGEDLEDLFSAFGGGRHASIFDQFFGSGGGRHPARPPQPVADQDHDVTVSFEQAALGTTLALDLSTAGNGRRERLEVKIPAGIDDGQKLRLRGKVPNPGGGPPGDLRLCIHVQPHAFFERQDADLFVDVPISISEAVLGAKIEVPTLEGRATLTIPPGTPSGSKLRLAGRGLRRRGGGCGDQYVAVKIVPPKTITDDQRRLFESLHEGSPGDPRANCPWNRRGT
ncbi:MAG: J domain-containing protein [Planctomycetota bacterium]